MFGIPLALAAAFFVRAGLKVQAAGAVTCGALLFVLAGLDIYTSMWRSPTGDAAIRVDLLFLLPIAGFLVLCAAISLRGSDR